MKVWAISDTHGFHSQLNVPIDIDAVIVGGDVSNSRDREQNFAEVTNFLRWLEILNIDHKIMIAGNHDTSIEARMIDWERYPSIAYLQHESCAVTYCPRPLMTSEALIYNIFGSPYTPSFGVGWAFNKDRGKLARYWDEIAPGTDIVVTHGPPQGILDLSYDRDGKLEMCGCKSLANRMDEIRPRYVIFGHIHDMRGITNHGMRTLDGVTYINASCVLDGRFDRGIVNHGVVFEI